ncbi:MAG: hypothetical protein ACR2F6_05230 [Mycobacteriales bacterium]
MPLLGTAMRLARSRQAQRLLSQAAIKARAVAADPRTKATVKRIRTRIAEEKAADKARRAERGGQRSGAPTGRGDSRQ